MKKEKIGIKYGSTFIKLFGVMAFVLWVSTVQVKAETVYNSDAALQYAAEHWADKDDTLCAEFVSDCIQAGGFDEAYSKSCNTLHSQLVNSDSINEYVYDYHGYIDTDICDVLTPGDVILYRCSDCRDGLPFIHAVLYAGPTYNGYARCYAHNNPSNASSSYQYSTRCYACGGSVDEIYVEHFVNGSSGPDGSVDVVESMEPGTIRVAGWAFDPDTDSPCEIHVYVGGPADDPKAEGHSGFYADNVERPDVNSTYDLSGNHGYDFTFETDKTGELEVYVYAIDDKSSDNNAFIDSGVVYVEERKESGYEDSPEQYDKPLEIDFEGIEDYLEIENGQEFDLMFKFAGDGIYTIGYDNSNSSIVSPIEWLNTDYSRGTSGIRIRACEPGETSFTIYLYNDKYDAIFSRSLDICVTQNNEYESNPDSSNSPIGSVDIVESDRPGVIRVAGWAFDPDTNSPCEIHVYVGGPADDPKAEGHSGFYANSVERPDVNSIYDLSGNHGYDFTFETDKTGELEVYVYAIDDKSSDLNAYIDSGVAFVSERDEVIYEDNKDENYDVELTSANKAADSSNGLSGYAKRWFKTIKNEWNEKITKWIPVKF